MEIVRILPFIIAILFFLFLLFALPLLIKKPRPEYIPKKPLSNREQEFYWKLLKTFPDKTILSQVDMKQIVEAKGNQKNRQLGHNKINQKSIDFLICNKDFTIITAIELDDSTHNNFTQRKRDDDKNFALSSAGIKLIRLRDIPTESELQKHIQS